MNHLNNHRINYLGASVWFSAVRAAKLVAARVV